jgi:hypothetical protein
MRALMILGCDGRVDDDFRFCSGVRNIILDFERIGHTSNYRTLIEYLDINSKLFDGPCCSTNVISNTTHKLFELGYLTEQVYNLTVQYFHFHRRCGLWLKIEPKET